MKNQRSDRDRRALPPTSRDLEIIRALVRHGQMIREQIQRLYFRIGGELASVQAACRRLRILTERGYLKRIRLPVTQGSGPYVYQPGKAAVAFLEVEERELLGRGARGRRVDSVSGLYHGLEVVDFYIGVKEALESRDGKVVAWLSESQARYRFPWHGKHITVSPDAYCLWAFEAEEGAFLLEWDRGTESMTRLSQKLQRYDAYYQLKVHHDHLGEMGLKPRLLIVVPDERREEKLVRWIARRFDKGEFRSLPTILVAVRDVVLDDVLGPIWRRPGQCHTVRFVD
jgi:hypothetical protein